LQNQISTWRLIIQEKKRDLTMIESTMSTNSSSLSLLKVRNREEEGKEGQRKMSQAETTYVASVEIAIFHILLYTPISSRSMEESPLKELFKVNNKQLEAEEDLGK
jgi:hypothetical protein